MISLSLPNALKSAPTLLFLGAHCDDIEIGCGGSIIELLKRIPDAAVHWIVFSSNETREKEARDSAQEYLNGVKDFNIEILNYRNGYFPHEMPGIKDFFESLKQRISPDAIFTHYRNDLHQDHRIINELTWNTFRNHLILEYEIAKYDGDLGTPNYFFPLSVKTKNQKIQRLIKHYVSQSDKHWFTDSTFEALMRIRGVECNAEGGFAEAFYARKITAA